MGDTIRVVGMSGDRALQIACTVFDGLSLHQQRVWGGQRVLTPRGQESDPHITVVAKRNRGVRVNSGRSSGVRLSEDARDSIRRLLGSGQSQTQIAVRLGMSSRTVARYSVRFNNERKSA